MELEQEEIDPSYDSSHNPAYEFERDIEVGPQLDLDGEPVNYQSELTDW